MPEYTQCSLWCMADNIHWNFRAHGRNICNVTFGGANYAVISRDYNVLLSIMLNLLSTSQFHWQSRLGVLLEKQRNIANALVAPLYTCTKTNLRFEFSILR